MWMWMMMMIFLLIFIATSTFSRRLNRYQHDVPIMLIQKSVDFSSDTEQWKSLKIYNSFPIKLRRRIISTNSNNNNSFIKTIQTGKIKLIRLKFPSSYNGIYVGGLSLIEEKYKKLYNIFNLNPAFVISNTINHEMALWATEKNIPLIGCSDDFDVPLGLGIDKPIWMSPPPIAEYLSLQKFIEKRGHRGSVVFFIQNSLLKPVMDHFRQLLLPNEVIIEYFQYHHVMTHRLKSKFKQIQYKLDQVDHNKIYIGIPFLPESAILLLLQSLKRLKKANPIAILLPHQAITLLNRPSRRERRFHRRNSTKIWTHRLRKQLITMDTYISATMDNTYLYKALVTTVLANNNMKRRNSKRLHKYDTCLDRSINIIIQGLNLYYSDHDVGICQSFPHYSLAQCVTNNSTGFYNKKRRAITRYLNKAKSSLKLKLNLRYIFAYYRYRDIASYPFLHYYRSYPIAVMNDNNMFVKTAHLRAVTYLHSPYVMVRRLTKNDNCNDDGYGLKCTMITISTNETYYSLGSQRKSGQQRGLNSTTKTLMKQRMCCFGLSIDILTVISRLQKFSAENKVQDANKEIIIGNYGMEIEVIKRYTPSNNSNGSKSSPKGIYLAQANLDNLLIDKLTDFTADLAIGSHVTVTKTNHNMSYLTKPYLSASIALMISKKGNLARYSTLTSFLDPFHWSMWLAIFITIQVAAVSTVIYEWHSPYGLTPRGRNRYRIFSFSSALTLCWSILFSHNVATKSPKCWSSRFLINVYACFCVIFLASYTANLAAYMVGERSLKEITGFHDKQIANGNVRLGTILGSGTEYYLRTAQVEKYKFIKLFINPEEIIEALRNGDIDAFVYDIEALQYYKRVYYADRFEIVGKPFAQVSYSIAFSKNLEQFGQELSNYLSRLISTDGFQKLLDQRLKLWTKEMTGVDPSTKWMSDSMKTKNFAGPLLLFLGGIVLGFLTLIVEYLVYYLVLPKLKRYSNRVWCLPISQRLHRHLRADGDYDKFTYSARHARNNNEAIVNRLLNHHRLSDNLHINHSQLLSFIVRNHSKPSKHPLPTNQEPELIFSANQNHDANISENQNSDNFKCTSCKQNNCYNDYSKSTCMSKMQYLHLMNLSPDYRIQQQDKIKDTIFACNNPRQYCEASTQTTVNNCEAETNGVLNTRIAQLKQELQQENRNYQNLLSLLNKCNDKKSQVCIE